MSEPHSGPAASPLAPKLAAMLVCDQVIKDEATKKSSIIGVFDKIFAGQFPAAHQKLTVYVSVIDAEGTTGSGWRW